LFVKHWGEDTPIWAERLERDGWILAAAGSIVKTDFDAKVKIEFDPPVTWEKVHPMWPNRYTLRMSIAGLKEKDGPSGDLLFASAGRLYRVRRTSKSLSPLDEAVVLADFSNRAFEERKASPEALRWPRLKET
jgi:hypothetical protein